MGHDCAVPEDGVRTWTSAEGMHLDLRGLEPPQPWERIVAAFEDEDCAGMLVVHFDEEPIALYADFDELGLSHELVPMCGHHDRADGVLLRLVRMRPADIRK